ncbi:hypothetical protein QYF36_018863 [Acer negundo]|nr:hypothetical protein QYF36_018863 [Acer negundo]
MLSLTLLFTLLELSCRHIRHEQASSKDGNSLGGNSHQDPGAAEPPGDETGIAKGETLIIGEHSMTQENRTIVDPGNLRHFQIALVNLVSHANKLGLALPIGLEFSSPYDLTAITQRNHPPGRLRLDVHMSTPDV